jgi:hypothetical protein
MPDNVVPIAGYHGKWAGDGLSLTSHSHTATGIVWLPLSTKTEEEGKVVESTDFYNIKPTLHALEQLHKSPTCFGIPWVLSSRNLHSGKRSFEFVRSKQHIHTVAYILTFYSLLVT